MRERSAIAAVRAALVAASVALALALAGCGGGSSHGGVASESPQAIVAAATSAIDRVHTVRVSGSVAAAGSETIDLDLQLVSGRGATGSLSENGLSFRLIALGGRAYVNGSPSFWRQFAGPAAASRLRGRWLSAPSGSGPFQSFSSLTDPHSLLSSLLGGHGRLTRSGQTTIRGTPAVALHDATRDGTLYVATKGPAYPLRLVKSGASGGRLDFSRFDAPVALAAPHSSIDISTIGR